MRVRRWAASLAVAVTLAGISASAASAVPPPVLPHPPPIAAQFRIHPDSGPVGTLVRIQGLCGFQAQTLLIAVAILDDDDQYQTIWIPPEGFPPLKPTPFGVFSVAITFPTTANVGPLAGQPITPGPYWVRAACNPPVVDMTPQEFLVTS